MRGFQLKKGSDKFDFDVAGNVKKNGGDFGKWAVSPDQSCNLVANKTGGGAEAFDVKWRFEDNELCLFSEDKKVFNFHDTDGERPFYSVTKKASLKVFPVAGAAFFFELRGDWDVTGNFDLLFDVNGERSLLDGHVKNDESLFKYFFTDNRHLFTLTFTGGWKGETNADGDIPLTFAFERAVVSPGGGEILVPDSFSLPGSARFDTAINQFVYEFEKHGSALSVRVQLVGTVQVSKNATITYSIQSQKDSSGKELVSATQIEIEAELRTEKFEGEVAIKYAIKHRGEITEKLFAIGGRFTSASKALEVVFAFEMKTNPSDPALPGTITFSGALKLSDKGQVVWIFRKEANAKFLEITVSDVKFKKFDISSKFSLISDDKTQQKTIRFLLGVSF